MFGLIDRLVPTPYALLAKALCLIGLALAAIYAWNQFTGHYIEMGRAELRPKIESLAVQRDDAVTKTWQWKASYDKLNAATQMQNVAIENLHQAFLDAQAKYKADQKAKAPIIASREDQLNRATLPMDKPPDGSNACEAAVQHAKEILKGSVL